MLSNKQKGLIILTIPFVLGLLLGLLIGTSFKSDKADKAETITAVTDSCDSVDESLEAEDIINLEGAGEDVQEAVVADDDQAPKKEVIYYRNRLQYAKLFNDMNDKHLEAAKKIGLQSVPKTRSDVNTGSLVKIENNRYYEIDNLRYSVPYLTKGAKHELDIIAKAFADSLKSKKLVDYKIVVTSVLRTEEDVKKLRRSGNPNASANSAHCYGTTFDITYTKYHRDHETSEFMQPFELTKVLGEVLQDQKMANHCLVKYEKKEHCFHITSLLMK